MNLTILVALALCTGLQPVGPLDGTLRVERVTTSVPFPRGLALVDDQLYLLCRGRVRSAGGVSAEVEDQAGTIYQVDPNVAEPIDRPEVGAAVRSNGRIFALPSDPPFRLWDRSANPPSADTVTDRPYCSLVFHRPTRSFYICAFSGIDKPKRLGRVSFSKNRSDAVLRYDLRTGRWYEVERHNPSAGNRYPRADPHRLPPPHGWLSGPDSCLTVANQLYVAGKDNNRLIRYDLTSLVGDPEAGCPPGRIIIDENLTAAGEGKRQYFGQSALAFRDGYLYVAYRTSSVIVRFRLNEQGLPVEPVRAQLVARFQPFDPVTLESANLTDMDFDSAGRLYVISAQPARIYRFKPDPRNIYDGTRPDTVPWLDLAARTSNPKTKGENILIDEQDRLFVTSGNGYDFQNLAYGTVYRVTGTTGNHR